MKSLTAWFLLFNIPLSILLIIVFFKLGLAMEPGILLGAAEASQRCSRSGGYSRQQRR